MVVILDVLSFMVQFVNGKNRKLSINKFMV